MKIAVLGAGAFGTALAIALARAGGQVTLWARDPVHSAEMKSTRTNARRLPGATLPESLTVSADIGDVAGAETLLLAMPMQKLAGFADLQPAFAPFGLTGLTEKATKLLGHLFHAGRPHDLKRRSRLGQIDFDVLVIELAFAQFFSKGLARRAFRRGAGQ